MPYSQVVEERYRLQASDLSGPARVTITNVTLEGLEDVRPVLHFDRLHKRLAISDIQSDEIARVTGSAVMSDWIGRSITLTVVLDGDGPRIALGPPDAPVRSQTGNPPQSTGPRRPGAVDLRPLLHAAHLTWQALLLLALIIALIAAVYALQNTEVLWRYVDEFGFPPRFR